MDKKHMVFFFDYNTLTNIVQTQQFSCLFRGYGANLYIGSLGCFLVRVTILVLSM